jgi:hypothetical protein
LQAAPELCRRKSEGLLDYHALSDQMTAMSTVGSIHKYAHGLRAQVDPSNDASPTHGVNDERPSKANVHGSVSVPVAATPTAPSTPVAGGSVRTSSLTAKHKSRNEAAMPHIGCGIANLMGMAVPGAQINCTFANDHEPALFDNTP